MTGGRWKPADKVGPKDGRQ